MTHRRTRASLSTLLAAAMVIVAACGEDSQNETANPGTSPLLPSVSPGLDATPSPQGEGGDAQGDNGEGGNQGGNQGGDDGGTGNVDAPAAFTAIPAIVEEVRPSVVSVLRSDGGEGSGVIWSSDGIVVTNNHVVEDASGITVVYLSGETVVAEVVATDPRTDLAVLTVDEQDLPAAQFREELPDVGELAIAIGAPLGFDASVTAGIVSGLGRAIPGSATQSPALIDLIQTDAAISPGNSGGALVGDDGAVMGINVAYIPPGAGAVAIGFAIPAATVINVVTQLIETGQVEHPYLGAGIATLTPRIAQAFGLEVEQGVIIDRIEPGGPADQAGLVRGDVIVTFAGEQVGGSEDLFAALRRQEVGDTVEVEVFREGERTTVEVELGRLPSRGQ